VTTSQKIFDLFYLPLSRISLGSRAIYETTMADAPPQPRLSEKDLFLKTLDLQNEDEQTAFLARECADDESQIARIKSLIRAHESNDDLLNDDEHLILDEQRASLAAKIENDSQFATKLGQTITQLGDYELISRKSAEARWESSIEPVSLA